MNVTATQKNKNKDNKRKSTHPMKEANIKNPQYPHDTSDHVTKPQNPKENLLVQDKYGRSISFISADITRSTKSQQIKYC